MAELFDIENYQVTPEIQSCIDALENGDNSIILGKAGTGKSHFIKYIKNYFSNKNIVVAAPTGLAALNVGGQTIHSFFKFAAQILTKDKIVKVWDEEKAAVFKKMDILIIDEISMVRADLMDAIDRFLILNGKDPYAPFGGVQVVLIGDLLQLPPVVTRQDQDFFSKFYPTPFFFSANCMQDYIWHNIELSTVFRQSDENFISMLNSVRNKDANLTNAIGQLNTRLGMATPEHTMLTPTNNEVESINKQRLAQLQGEAQTYVAKTTGQFKMNEKSMPVDEIITLKVDAKVILLKNDPNKRWVNGTKATVTAMHDDHIEVCLDNSPPDRTVEITGSEWNSIKYEYNKKSHKLMSEVVGTLRQLPVKLAWAMTVHKSQGMTLDKVFIQMARGMFAHGQAYTALSRCKSFEGLVLGSRLNHSDIILAPAVAEFYSNFQRNLAPLAKTPIKFIFLDFDGVLNNLDFLKKHKGKHTAELDPDNIAQLERIVKATGAYIVVSSTWRRGKSSEFLAGVLFAAGLYSAYYNNVVVSVTPVGRTKDNVHMTYTFDGTEHTIPMSDLGPHVPRGDEIGAWLRHFHERNPDKIASNYIIIDDDSDMGEHMDHFIQTSFNNGGLTEEIADKCIARLGRIPNKEEDTAEAVVPPPTSISDTVAEEV